jgi:hypothetical protein
MWVIQRDGRRVACTLGKTRLLAAGTPKAFASRRLPLQHSSLSNFPRNLGSDFGQYLSERQNKLKKTKTE